MDLREFFAGSIAGCAGQIIGHPLDTVKVRMQADAGGVRDAGAIRCAVRTFAEGGALAFFRGMSIPILFKSVEQCVAFGVRGWADRFLGEVIGLDSGRVRSGLAGATAGASTAALLTPVYLIKVQLQVTSREGLKGPFAAAYQIITKSPRGILGLYTGATPILLGTTIGYAFRFATYDHIVKYTKDLGANNTMATILGGGLAGMATWASHYPLDLLSARMQAAASSKDPPMKMLGHFRQILVQQGLSGLFRGIGPCLLRAFPVNATIFLTYELCMK